MLWTYTVTGISLDHDLSDDARGTGYDVLLWVEEAFQQRGFVPPRMLALVPATKRVGPLC